MQRPDEAMREDSVGKRPHLESASLQFGGPALQLIMRAEPAPRPAQTGSYRSAPKHAATEKPVAQTADATACKNGTFPSVSDFLLGDPRSLTHVAAGLHSPKIRASRHRFAQKTGSCLFVIRPMPRTCIAPMNGSSVQSGQCAHPDSEDSAAPQFRRFCGEAEHMRGERHVQRLPVQCLR